MARKCRLCKQRMAAVYDSQKLTCGECNKKWERVKSSAMSRVARAIAHGLLEPPSNQLCADCGETAHGYDHRDYSKPLVVAAVCRSCNRRRGSAKLNKATKILLFGGEARKGALTLAGLSESVPSRRAGTLPALEIV